MTLRAYARITWYVMFYLGMVEICAKILQIMRNDFKDYARTFANYAHIMHTFFSFVLHIIGIRQ